ncbi:MAG: hypothetical protein HKN29_06425 [Rhodothermales bacterium]|nr:hypothetical protein [Rhodothermales bacterium]
MKLLVSDFLEHGLFPLHEAVHGNQQRGSQRCEANGGDDDDNDVLTGHQVVSMT